MLTLTEDVRENLHEREAFRDGYNARKDPIFPHRLRWRLQTVRHIVHLLPGQRILLVGAGEGPILAALDEMTRGENPITALTFRPRTPAVASGTSAGHPDDSTRIVGVDDIVDDESIGTFDLVVGFDLLDYRSCDWLIANLRSCLSPGGALVLYESNPWNPVFRLRSFALRPFGHSDRRLLLNRTSLYELLSDAEYVKVFTVYNDFVYAPLTTRLIWLLRNLSIVLENTPLVQTFAGSLLVHARRPPVSGLPPVVGSLADRPELYGQVSVVIPCFNEAMNVRGVVSRLKELYDAYLLELVLVDDNSSDGTGRIIEELQASESRIVPVFRRCENGVGRALAAGIARSRGAYVLTMDCDFLHLLPEFRDLFDAAASGHVAVIGSRFSRNSVVLNYPLAKIVANRGFHLIAQPLLGARFRDVTNNLKLFRRELVDRLVLHERHFSANAETGLLPLLMGYELHEVPISWVNRSIDMGRSSFKLAAVGGGYCRVLFHLFRARWFGRGRYAAMLGRPRTNEVVDRCGRR